MTACLRPHRAPLLLLLALTLLACGGPVAGASLDAGPDAGAAVDDELLVLTCCGVATAANAIDGGLALAPNGSDLVAGTIAMSVAGLDAGQPSLSFDLAATVSASTRDWTVQLSNTGGAVTRTAPAGFDLEVRAGPNASATGEVEVLVTRRDQGPGPVKTRRARLVLQRK